jgi:ribosomal protein S18 acetylase RimI-like enzyme
VLAPIRGEDVVEVAKLHCEALPGLLSALGPGLAQAVYEGYVASPRRLGFVEVEGGVLQGFVLGSDAPEAWRREARDANRWAILRGLAAGLRRRPRALRDVLSMAVTMGTSPPNPGEGAGAFDPRTPELTYIAVAERARRRGVGARLFDAFADAARARGARAFELSVEVDNPRAAAFYEARGMRVACAYRQFGRAYRRYRLDLAPPAPGGG